MSTAAILVPLLAAFALIVGAIARQVRAHDDDEFLTRLAAGMPTGVPEADELDLFVTLLRAWRDEARQP